MSDQSATAPTGTEHADVKGKGKVAAEAGPDMSMDEEETTDEEEAPEEEVPEEEDDDNMEEIDASNIIGGRRTRGKEIDFQKAAAEAGNELDDDDEDDDEDFHGHEDEDDAMQE